MFRCRMVNFLFSIIPLRIGQDFLLRKHIRNCASCQENLASLEEIKSLLIQEAEVGDLEGLWPKVEVQLAKEERKEKVFCLPSLVSLQRSWVVASRLNTFESMTSQPGPFFSSLRIRI